MEQSPSWEANRSLASQEIPRVLWNPKVHYSLTRARHLSLSSWVLACANMIHPHAQIRLFSSGGHFEIVWSKRVKERNKCIQLLFWVELAESWKIPFVFWWKGSKFFTLMYHYDQIVLPKLWCVAVFARFLVYLFTGLHYHTRYGRNERRSSRLHLQRVNNRNDSADPKRVRDMFAAYFSNFCSLDDKKNFLWNY
jgi:hypothetical protein